MLTSLLTQTMFPLPFMCSRMGATLHPIPGAGYVRSLEEALPAATTIATVCGRYFAMDRDNRWDRVSKAFAALVRGQGIRFDTPQAAIASGYAQGQPTSSCHRP